MHEAVSIFSQSQVTEPVDARDEDFAANSCCKCAEMLFGLEEFDEFKTWMKIENFNTYTIYYNTERHDK